MSAKTDELIDIRGRGVAQTDGVQDKPQPASAEFAEVMAIRGRGMPAADEVRITGADPVFSTRFRIGGACANVLAGVGVAVNDIWEQKTGRRQQASIDVRHAAATLRSSHYLQAQQADGEFVVVESPSMRHMATLTQPWPTRDGRWFLPHFNLPNLQARVLGVLGCEATPESASAAVRKWDALDLEAAIDEAGACGAMVRSNEEWLAHAHGQALAALPLVQITKIADSAPQPFPEQGSDAHPGRAGGCAHARRARRGGVDGHRRASAAGHRTRARHQPWQAQLFS